MFTIHHKDIHEQEIQLKRNAQSTLSWLQYVHYAMTCYPLHPIPMPLNASFVLISVSPLDTAFTNAVLHGSSSDTALPFIQPL